MTALQDRLRALAEDVGRLRRLTDADTYGAFILERAAGHLETIDNILSPTAGQLVHDLKAFGVDEDEAVAEALAEVDARARALHLLLDDGAIV